MQIQDSVSTRQTFFEGTPSIGDFFSLDLWLPPQESTTAHQIDGIFAFILIMSTILTLIVTAAMVYFIYKYRRRSNADRAVDVKESKLLELSWVVIPTLLVLVVFFWGFTAYVSTSIPPPGSYTINVTGQKWLWTFEYPNGHQTSKEIVVPVGTPIRLEMTSTDVLHSFYVPEFRIKHDVVPNRYSYVWFEAKEQGTYQVVCTEYCGTQHSNMGALIKVVSYDEFSEWMRNPPDVDGPRNVLGAQLYEQKACNSCHSIDGSPGVGPSWLGIWGTNHGGVTVDSAYVHQSIVEPGAFIVPGFQNQMPSYQGQLTDDQIDYIIAYIKDINGAADPEDLAIPGEEGAEADGAGE